MKCIEIDNAKIHLQGTEDESNIREVLTNYLNNNPDVKQKVIRQISGEIQVDKIKSKRLKVTSKDLLTHLLSTDYKELSKIIDERLDHNINFVVTDELQGKLSKDNQGNILISSSLYQDGEFKEVISNGVKVKGEEIVLYNLLNRTLGNTYDVSEQFQKEIQSIVNQLSNHKSINNNKFFKALTKKPKDFLMLSLTNRDFQKVLAGIQIEDNFVNVKTGWSRILDIVKKFLGVRQTSALDSIFGRVGIYDAMYLDTSAYKFMKESEDFKDSSGNMTAALFKKVMYGKKAISVSKAEAEDFNSINFDSKFAFIQATSTSKINGYSKGDYIMVYRSELVKNKIKPVIGLNTFFDINAYDGLEVIQKGDYIEFRKKGKSNSEKGFVTSVSKNVVKYKKADGSSDTIPRLNIKQLGKQYSKFAEENVSDNTKETIFVTKPSKLDTIKTLQNIEGLEISAVEELGSNVSMVTQQGNILINMDEVNKVPFYETGLLEFLSPELNSLLDTYAIDFKKDAEQERQTVLGKFFNQDYLTEIEQDWFSDNASNLETALQGIVNQLKGFGLKTNNIVDLQKPLSQLVQASFVQQSDLSSEARKIKNEILMRNYCKLN